MKVIFDFDDTLFSTKDFKKYFYSYVGKFGISYESARDYYLNIRGGEFSLKKYLSDLLAQKGLMGVNVGKVYKDILSQCPNFIDHKLIKLVKKIGRENCYIVSNGEKEFQQDKIKKSGIGKLFGDIHIVPASKKEVIEKICGKNKKERIIFIDDKIRFLNDLDLKKCPNLKTILYDEQGLEKLKAELGLA